MDPVMYDKLVRVACGAAIYIVIGLMMWLEFKTQDDIHIKMYGRPKYKNVNILKLIFLWLPLWIWAIMKDIATGINYLVKKIK
jgi:hypothetical protein